MQIEVDQSPLEIQMRKHHLRDFKVSGCYTHTQTQVTEEVDQRVGCEVDQLKRQINADST